MADMRLPTSLHAMWDRDLGICRGGSAYEPPLLCIVSVDCFFLYTKEREKRKSADASSW